MKNYFLPSGLSLGLMLFMSLSGCETVSPNTDSPTPVENSESKPFLVEVGTYTSDELFAAGGGGCGMTLWENGTNISREWWFVL